MLALGCSVDSPSDSSDTDTDAWRRQHFSDGAAPQTDAGTGDGAADATTGDSTTSPVDATTDAATGTLRRAASCSLADVSSAVASAVDGDTVAISSGSCTWSSSLSITKSITLQGAGATSTVISSSMASYSSLIDVTPNSDTALTRITGRTIFACRRETEDCFTRRPPGPGSRPIVRRVVTGTFEGTVSRGSA